MAGKTKKLAAIDLLINSQALKPALSQDSARSRSPVSNLRNGIPVEISPEACRPWRLADRPLNEAQHKDELAESFQESGIGQIQPIVVRKVEDPTEPAIHYEVICGRVRWLAAKQLGVPVQAVVRELSDREAYEVMSAENRQRRNLSDFAKAKSYQKALSLGVFDSAQQLADAEGIAKSKLSLYLGFAELPDEVAASFADMTRIPYRLGYEIYKACQALGVEEVLKMVPKIESGELSRGDVQQLRANWLTAISESAGGQAPALPLPLTADRLDASSTNQPAGYGLWDLQPTPVEIPAEAANGASPSALDGAIPAANPSAPPVDDARPSILHIQSQTRNIFVSPSGQKLFTYNHATRGCLIRIAPEVSPSINEDFMRKLGQLIESYYAQPK